MLNSDVIPAIRYTGYVKARSSGSHILAVSGGVDSVVMFDMARRHYGAARLIVAHFDHGIRSESVADARFVAALAMQYGCMFRTQRVELGARASEDAARQARYDFLYAVAQDFHADIWLAHHQEDVVESVAVNLTRGTGWRGLAVMDRPKLCRPLLYRTKREIYAYACRYRLEWVEDESNQKDGYLRNRLRRKISKVISSDDQARIVQLRDKQVSIKHKMIAEITSLLPDTCQARYFLTQIPRTIAEEMVRIVIEREAGVLVARPHAARALAAIQTLRIGAVCQVADGVCLTMTKKGFIVRRRA